MKPFVSHAGLTIPLDRADVDTDQIIPKQFLKRIERTGFGEYLFYDWRRASNGQKDPTFEFNDPRYAGATVLIAGTNFGCGSSREHAVWALQDFGIRVVIAPSFADIFYTNCLGSGLLPITLDSGTVSMLMEHSRRVEWYAVRIDLERMTVTDSQGASLPFVLDAFHRHRLLNGLDDIALTLEHEAAITAYEAQVAQAAFRP